MIVAIHQPAYFPWIGLVEKIALADQFIVLDNVQFNARSFQHRTLYSSATGPKYLTLPVHSHGHQIARTLICEIPLADVRAGPKHFKTLAQRYGKRPGWALVAEQISFILHTPVTHFLEVVLATIRLTLHCFNVHTRVVLASALPGKGRKTELMLSLTQAVGGTTYLSGTGARDYIQPDLFTRANIGLAYQDFRHPVYRQSHRGNFQEGCLALEWYFEDPDNAALQLRAHIDAARERISLT